jgi:hypothetical protein
MKRAMALSVDLYSTDLLCRGLQGMLESFPSLAKKNSASNALNQRAPLNSKERFPVAFHFYFDGFLKMR